MKERIIQFGGGNFLRGFADDFIDSLNKQGLFDGSVVVVQSTASKTGEIINSQGGKYHLLVRGIENGEKTDSIREIDCISRCINANTKFEELLSLAHNPDMKIIISNTTEAGIEYDSTCEFSDTPQRTFPGKLTRLLYERFKAELDGLIILPCELIDSNADKLKECVVKYAEQWALGEEFIHWLSSENHFCSTLVDRIVSGFPKAESENIFRRIGTRDMLLDVAEPYHLWVVEGDFEKEFPLKSGGVNVVWTDSVEMYKKRKVRVLNGSHTLLVFPALLCGIETVSEAVDDKQLSELLSTCLNRYILRALGENESNIKFANAVLERFHNPYLAHRWESISLNSVSKFSARVLPTVEDIIEKGEEAPLLMCFSLASLIYYYKNYEPKDLESAVSFIKSNSISDILSNTELWGKDLAFLLPATEQCYEKIEKSGIREALGWALSL